MRPLILVWPYALVFWTVYAWVFLPETALILRARRAAAGRQDRGSLRALVVGQPLVQLAAFVTAFTLPGATVHGRAMAFWAGVILLVAGSLLRRHCFRMLGPHFSAAVTTMPDQPIVERGAYRWVRHPSYTAGMMVLAGVGFALTNWVSVVLLILVPMALFAYRVVVEEQTLVASFGEPYRAYMRRTKRFVPFIL